MFPSFSPCEGEMTVSGAAVGQASSQQGCSDTHKPNGLLLMALESAGHLPKKRNNICPENNRCLEGSLRRCLDQSHDPAV